MALTDKLSAIGDAIREKTGKTELLTLDQMPTEIASITTGGGGAEVEPIVLTGDQGYGCAGAIAGNYIKNFGDTISTNNLRDTQYMFLSSPLEKIPFELNYNPAANYINIEKLFQNSKIKEVPKINQCKPANTSSMFDGCNYLRYLPEDMEEWFDWTYLDNLRGAYGGGNRAFMFRSCYSLRSVPMGFLNHCNPNVYVSSQMYYYLFYGCYSLDEIVGLPIPYADEMEYASNLFENAFTYCTRIKNLTFATNEDGTPIVVKWKNQIINLTSVGFGNSSSNYNSGITADKKVTDDATYQALKDDPDWFTASIYYSRYNHDSAVATINSLPDTSAYLAEKGGTNTIKFTGNAGSATDGGAINTLTEEEIAVAAAKGWTVTLV